MPEEIAEIVSWTAEALRGILNIIQYRRSAETHMTGICTNS